MALAEEDVRERWSWYEQLAGVARTAPHLPPLPLAGPGRSRRRGRERGSAHQLPWPGSCVARWSPRRRRWPGSWRGWCGWRGLGSGAVVLPSLFEEQLDPRPAGAGPVAGDDRGPHRRGPSYFPELADYNSGPWRLPGPHRPGQAGAVGAGDRQPQRDHPRAVGRARRGLRDAGADALELNLYTVATDPRVGGGRARGPQLELVARRACGRVDPAGGQARARSTPPWPTSPSGLDEAGAAGWSCSTASASPTWTSTVCDVVPRLVLSTSEGAAPPLALDRHPVRAARSVAGRHHRRPHWPRRGRGAAGWGERGHDDLGVAAPWARACPEGGGRAGGWSWPSTNTTRWPSCAAV